MRAGLEWERKNTENKEIVKKFIEKKRLQKMKRVLVLVRRVQSFERKWLSRVRYELYFKHILKVIVQELRDNCRSLQAGRCIAELRALKWINILKIPVARSKSKYQGLLHKFQKRHLRKVFAVIANNVAVRQRKKNNQ